MISLYLKQPFSKEAELFYSDVKSQLELEDMEFLEILKNNC